MRRLSLALALALALGALAAPGAESLATVTPRTSATVEADLEIDRDTGGTARVEWRFQVTEPSLMYAKVLTTPWNPIDSNGSYHPDAGVETGWMVQLTLADGEGNELLRDGRGEFARGDLGVFVDGNRTRDTYLAANTTYTLIATIRAPGESLTASPASYCPDRGAPGEGTLYCVNVAVAIHPAAEDTSGLSGGRIDPSLGLKAVLRAHEPSSPLLQYVLMAAAAVAIAAAGGIGAHRLIRWRSARGGAAGADATPAAPTPASGIALVRAALAAATPAAVRAVVPAPAAARAPSGAAPVATFTLVPPAEAAAASARAPRRAAPRAVPAAVAAALAPIAVRPEEALPRLTLALTDAGFALRAGTPIAGVAVDLLAAGPTGVFLVKRTETCSAETVRWFAKAAEILGADGVIVLADHASDAARAAAATTPRVKLLSPADLA